MLQAVTETDVQVVTARLIDLARDGNLTAMKLLFDVIGKPTATEALREPAASLTREQIREIADRVRTASAD
jgi:hypothetical protein